MKEAKFYKVYAVRKSISRSFTDATETEQKIF